MNRWIKITIAIALAASMLVAAGGLMAMAAPAPIVFASSAVLVEDAEYDGDVQINAKDSSGNPITVDLNGKSVVIHGNLNILGTLDVNDGSITVDGGVTISGGLLKMTKSSAAGKGSAVVKGNFVTNGRDHTGALTAGTLDVRGDFIQYGDFSAKAFCPSGTFKTKLSGTNKTLWFETPGGSYLYNYEFATGITFKSVSVMSLSVSLSANADMTGYAHLYLRGALNGKTLTAPANTVVAGTLTLGGGRLNVNGALEVGPDGGLVMTNAADYVYVNGNFVTKGHCDCRDGTVEVNGNFSQLGVASGFHDDSYVGLPAHLTKIMGTGRKARFDSPAVSSFGELQAASALTSDSVVSLNCDLPAASVITWAYPVVYYAGHMNGSTLTVTNNLYARGIVPGGGTLNAEKNFTSAAMDCLVMTNAADTVIVKGNYTASHSMNPADLTAGLLEIDGNFAQGGASSSFLASGTHVTRLVGANKSVVFANPGASWFNRLELSGGATFATGSVLSMKCSLADITELTVPLMYYSGSMNGHDLLVTGNLRLFGDVVPGGGTIRATGNMALDGVLTFTDPADGMEIGGDFTGSGSATLTGGTVEFKKSFRYTGPSWQASGTNVTVLSGGADMPVTFSAPAASWFAGVAIASGTTLSGDSVLSVKAAGAADLEVTAPVVYLQGNLGGRSAEITGDLTIPAGTTLTIGGGDLSVSGDMAVNNSYLAMTNAADAVTVGGNFTIKGLDHTGKLTNGKLTIRGDFQQLRTLPADSPKAFLASGNHITVFAGSVTQHVSLATPGTTDGSRFAKIYRLNPDVIFDFSTAPGQYCTSCDLTSAKLRSLSGSGGVLVPAFDPDVTDYIYVLPQATTATTISAQTEYASPNATMKMNGSAVESLNVTGVPYDSASTVSIIVTAIDGIDEATYTVKVERLNLDLQSIAVSGGALAPSFDAATTSYTVSLPASTESVTVTPLADNPDTTLTINGAAVASAELALKPGETVTAQIVTTGQNGTSHKTYTVQFTRADILTGFGQSLGTLSPDWSSPVADYTLELSALQDSVTLTPVKAPGCTALTIDGEPRDTADFTLTLGEQKTVQVIAAAGEATFTYRVTLKRKPIISGFGLSPAAGAVLTPAFNGEGGAFALTVPATTINLTILPSKVDCTSVMIDDLSDELPPAADSVTLHLAIGESRTLEIVAQDGPTLSRTFTLTVTRGAIVTGLAMSQGTLSPAFTPAVQTYTVHVPANTAAVYVTPTLISASASVKVNGQNWNANSPVTVNPAPGGSATLSVVGTEGTASVTYTVTVYRDKPLSGLQLLPSGTALTPAFNAATGTYSVLVPATVASVTIEPTKTADCTSLSINGTVQNSVVLTPGIGATATATIDATGPGGSAVTRYTVNVQRQALLSDIKLSVGRLNTSFNGGTLSYNVYLSNTITSVTITPVKTASCSAFTINNTNATSITLKPTSGNMAMATIKALGTAAGIEQTFTVRVYRIAPVTGIGLTSGKLSPAFDIMKSAYTVSVPAGTTSVKITPTKGASCSSMLINGQAVSSVVLSPGIGGSANATVAATARNGQNFTYKITVQRAALLRGISLSTGKLSPVFNVATLSYSVYVPATTSSVKVTPSKATTGVYSMTINGRSASSSTLTPPVGGTATATIKLTSSSNRNVTQTYTVVVRRAPLLTGISATAGTLSPAFSAAKTAYTLTLPADTASTVVSYSKATTGVKSVTMNGYAVTSTAVTVGKPGGSATVTIVALATDSKTKATYTVTVKRAPILSGITVAGGTLSPAFNAATGSYIVSIPATTARVTLTPKGAAECSSITIDGVAAVSKVIAPSIGGSRTATIVARTAAGTTSTYTVRVVRAALVTGIRTSTSSYPISPKFSATTLSYTVTIPATRSSITIYATKASSGVKSLTMNGRAVTSVLVKPPVGGSSTVSIVATASNGTTKVTYLVTVKRNSLVSGITTDSGTLSPAFTTAGHSYTVLIPATKASAKITVATTPAAKTVKINNATTKIVTLSPAVGSYAKATIVVTATDGVTKDTYTVIVRRVAPLAGVTLSTGTGTLALTPAFSPAVQAYDVTVPAATPSVTVTPAAASGCSFTINGDNEPFVTETNPGAGLTSTVTIIATASGGISITYTITLHWS